MTMMGSIDACLGVLADVLKILGIVSSQSLCVDCELVCFNWNQGII